VGAANFSTGTTNGTTGFGGAGGFSNFGANVSQTNTNPAGTALVFNNGNTSQFNPIMFNGLGFNSGVNASTNLGLLNRGTSGSTNGLMTFTGFAPVTIGFNTSGTGVGSTTGYPGINTGYTTGPGFTTGAGATLNNSLLDNGVGMAGANSNPNAFLNVGTSMNTGLGNYVSPGLSGLYSNTGFLGGSTPGFTTSPFVLPTTGMSTGMATSPFVLPTGTAFNAFSTSPFLLTPGTSSGSMIF